MRRETRSTADGCFSSRSSERPLCTRRWSPYRILFTERLERALARTERRTTKVAVLFVDLDDFKEVNDSLGHEAGDRVLVAAAHRVRGCLRPTDTAARLGGDEFTVLLEDIEDARGAVRVARRILGELRA